MTQFEHYYVWTPVGLIAVAAGIWLVVLPWLDRMNRRDLAQRGKADH